MTEVDGEKWSLLSSAYFDETLEELTPLEINTKSKLTLVEDMFTNMCYLWGHSCVCLIKTKWITIYPRGTRGFPYLTELQKEVNEYRKYTDDTWLL